MRKKGVFKRKTQKCKGKKSFTSFFFFFVEPLKSFSFFFFSRDDDEGKKTKVHPKREKFFF